jgi:hypothetical protein
MSASRNRQKATVPFNRIYAPGSNEGLSFRRLLRRTDKILNVRLCDFTFVCSSLGLKIHLRRVAEHGVA